MITRNLALKEKTKKQKHQVEKQEETGTSSTPQHVNIKNLKIKFDFSKKKNSE